MIGLEVFSAGDAEIARYAHIAYEPACQSISRAVDADASESDHTIAALMAGATALAASGLQPKAAVALAATMAAALGIDTNAAENIAVAALSNQAEAAM